MADNFRAADAHDEIPDGSGLRIGVVCSRFNDAITNRLLSGVRRGAAACGVREEDLIVEWVPGAFELPFAARTLIAARDQAGTPVVDAVVAIGCVIRGATTHYEMVAGECSSGIQRVQLDTGVPVIFGALTTEDEQQALERSEDAGGHNVGEEGARTAVEMVRLARKWATPGQNASVS